MTYNGSSGGTFRGLGGVHVTERRLRLLLGLEINDARLIRPASAPSLSRVAFDWEMSLTEAMMRRSEIRRQRLKVQQRELELLAARNFLLPQFDVVARYRWRGLGRNWLGDYPDADPAAAVEFGQSSLENLFGGKFEEWQLGGELTFPIGFRRAHAAVRNAQLQTARERAVLDEQERRVLFDLSNAIADLERAYEISQTAFNRRAAAKQQMDILLYRQQRGVQPNVDQQPNLDQLIDAQRRFADADSQYHRALAEYMIAVKNVHYEKGTLLEYCQVHLAEPSGIGCDYSPAVRDRWLRNRRFRVLDYVLRRPVADCEMVASPEKASEQAPIEQIEPPVVPESLRFESVPPQPAG
jgi:outer membrane protein TolC